MHQAVCQTLFTNGILCVLHVCCQVLLNNEFPFKLGGKTFDFVLDVFLYHDFSVLGFVRTFEV